MPPQTPVLIVDNVFDTITQYPNGTLTTSSERTGHEGYRVADYRRERTSWQTITTAAFHFVTVDIGAPATTIVDTLFIDRGHNLWGKTVRVFGDNPAGTAGVARDLIVPAIGTLGGDPASGTMCVTEEGALYGFFTPMPAREVFLVYIVDSWAPVIPGLILGKRTQLLGYSNTFDEDAGERMENSAISTAGYRGTDTTYSWRTCDIGLSLVGASEYDATMRALRELLFKRNQPVVIAMDYGTRPERAWMYQFDGKSWGMAKKRVHREGRLRFREVGQSLS